MKTQPTFLKPSLILLATLALTSANCMAGDDDNSGWYIGANLGQSSNTVDQGRINNSLMGSGLTSTGSSSNNSSTGGKIFLGYSFNSYFSLEGGYFDLGSLGFSSSTNPAGSLNGTLKPQGENLDLVASYPFTDDFSVFARAGGTYNQVKADFNSSGAALLQNSYTDNGGGYKVGVGLEYAFTKALSMRLEAERYQVPDALQVKEYVNLFSVGLVYRFGGPAPAPAPVVVAPPPPPPPPVVVAPPPPPPPPPAPKPPKTVNFAADSFFDTNKATLKPAGEESLNKFAHDLDGVKYSDIKVIGHTDYRGSVKLNDALSVRRADAVKQYLISLHIDAGKITTKGVGSTEPMTKPDECKKKKGAALSACLAPDRRVQIDVSGTE